MKLDYKENYQKLLKESQEFVNYWLGIIQRRMCLKLTPVDSENLQKAVLCDTQEGFEFKYDRKFKETGNFWIEIEEKRDPSQEKYVLSGILREDNAWMYCIGNYDELFFLPKRTLISLYNSGKVKTMDNNEKTSRGFLINKLTAIMHSVAELTCLDKTEEFLRCG